MPDYPAQGAGSDVRSATLPTETLKKARCTGSPTLCFRLLVGFPVVTNAALCFCAFHLINIILQLNEAVAARIESARGAPHALATAQWLASVVEQSRLVRYWISSIGPTSIF